MKVTIYHNPRCSKSRQTLELLVQNGIEPEIIEYLKAPPSKSELSEILELLGLTPRELLRKQEQAYNEAGLTDDNHSDEQLITAMIEHPILIERPIVLVNSKAAIGQESRCREAQGSARAAIGRPPESVLEIL